MIEIAPVSPLQKDSQYVFGALNFVGINFKALSSFSVQ